jgi:hypothetical protein
MARQAAAVAMVLGAAMMSGCRIDSQKKGDNENVKIATPFGGMQVKTGSGCRCIRGPSWLRRKTRTAGPPM